MGTGRHEGPEIVAAIELLASRGAGDIPHPGGTLLAHLRRVEVLLGEWGARPALRYAGLCHAYYGTDGFRTAPGDVARRGELAAVIGDEAEQIVYFYASCDRDFSYPHLADPVGEFRDRFTGTVSAPRLPARRDFAELTVANELDIVRVNPRERIRIGPLLLDLLTSWWELLSAPARDAVQATLA